MREQRIHRVIKFNGLDLIFQGSHHGDDDALMTHLPRRLLDVVVFPVAKGLKGSHRGWSLIDINAIGNEMGGAMNFARATSAAELTAQ